MAAAILFVQLVLAGATWFANSGWPDSVSLGLTLWVRRLGPKTLQGA
jgi:hypothetical protein